MPATPRRILVANRGEIVSRVARSAHHRGISVVAVYVESDRQAHFIGDADLAVNLGEDSARSPYLDIEKLVQVALETECDAVHPGYGFLAENSEFARAVINAGLIWIGPPPEAMDFMAGKVGAKIIAQAVGVPVLDSIELTNDVGQAAAAARRALIPPVLVKPSAGGGGKGMHRVDDLDELPDVLRAAQREAIAAFGDGTLFIERYLETARHVEVQVLADEQGNVVHLGTRDCSIQRRHQKIVEEAPAPRVPAQVLEEMCSASIDLARKIGYVGAGTVEFLVFADGYAFLEMNTRLQVEHPVTEMVAGVDLVDLQIAVASGAPLPFTQKDVRIEGHAFEVRLYAEDPAANFMPSPGTIGVFDFPEMEGIRWEVGVVAGSPVNPRYDPMIAKIVARGRYRDEARHRLVQALRSLRISGVRTNREMLIAVLENEDFAGCDLATRFLEDHPDLANATTPAHVVRQHIAAAVLHGIWQRKDSAAVQRFAPRAWRNLRSQDIVVELRVDGDVMEVGYRPEDDGYWALSINGVVELARCLSADASSIDLEVGSRRTCCQVANVDGEIVVTSPEGLTIIVEVTRIAEESQTAAGALVSPLPGIVVHVERQSGDQVVAGDTLIVIEAMKMEHRIKTAVPGTVTEIFVSVGEVVGHDQVVAAIDAEDPQL